MDNYETGIYTDRNISIVIVRWGFVRKKKERANDERTD